MNQTLLSALALSLCPAAFAASVILIFGEVDGKTLFILAHHALFGARVH